MRRMLRLQSGALNEHNFRHNFDCLSPVCICGAAKEDNEHFLLHIPLYDIMRCDLHGPVPEIPVLDISNYDPKSLCTLLLFGSLMLNVIENRMIVEAMVFFLKGTKWFD